MELIAQLQDKNYQSAYEVFSQMNIKELLNLLCVTAMSKLKMSHEFIHSKYTHISALVCVR